MSFSQILGQERAVALLRADINSGRIAETYLFVGPEGAGKRRTALELAKALNCTGAESAKQETESGELEELFGSETKPHAPLSTLDSDSCGQCSSCKKIDSGNHPDVFVLDFESQARLLDMKEDEKMRQKDLRIDSVRILINQSLVSPLEGKKKVFIIDGAERLNEESGNALLKSLEESSKRAHWILIAVGAERVISTIQSRSRKISFSPLSGEIRKKIKLETRSYHSNAEEDDFDDEPFEKLAEKAIQHAFSEEPPILKEILGVGEHVLGHKRKISQRKLAERFLKILSLKMSRQLHQNPESETAEKLSLILQSQDELRRNVSPQLVLDTLFLELAASQKKKAEMVESNLATKGI